MPIMSVSEFEAVVSQAINKVQRVMHATGEDPALKEVVRDLESINTVARDPERLKPMRDKLDRAAEVIRVKLPRHDDLRNDMWDCLDFIDYRV